MSNKELIIETNKKSIKIRTENILYITTNKEKDHSLSLVTEKKVINCRGTLDDFEKNVGDSFFRCHRSIIVNLSKISEIDRTKKKIFFRNNLNCSFSRRNLTPLINAWKNN